MGGTRLALDMSAAMWTEPLAEGFDRDLTDWEDESEDVLDAVLVRLTGVSGSTFGI